MKTSQNVAVRNVTFSRRKSRKRKRKQKCIIHGYSLMGLCGCVWRYVGIGLVGTAEANVCAVYVMKLLHYKLLRFETVAVHYNTL